MILCDNRVDVSVIDEYISFLNLIANPSQLIIDYQNYRRYIHSS